MDAQSPITQYDTLISSHAFVFIVFYRGHWCPFCISYLRTLETLTPAITSSGGLIIAITSEPLEHLSSTRQSSGYTGLVITDPSNLLALALKRRGVIDVAISEKKGYEHGMAQPAILVAREVKVDGEREGEKRREVLEKWAIVPSAMNLGGAKDRPDLRQVWDNVKAKVEGREVVHRKYDLIGVFGTIVGKIFGR